MWKTGMSNVKGMRVSNSSMSSLPILPVYVFGRWFYPNWMTFHSSYTFYRLPGDQTHDLGVVTVMPSSTVWTTGTNLLLQTYLLLQTLHWP